MPDINDAALLSASYSRYAARVLHAQPQLAAQIAELARAPLSREVIAQRLEQHCAQAAAPLTEAGLKIALRRTRTEVLCAVMERDLRGAALAEVTGAMTDLAELAIRRALQVLAAHLEAQFGAPRSQNGQGERQMLGVVGMGKLGGRELNVSSDLDLIFVYEEDGETRGGARTPITYQEFFTRLGRRLISALAEVTADGYVFRVDMRLRPNGEAGPLVCSLAMLEEYFTVQGREWERYAWIKGRLVSEASTIPAQRLEAALSRIVTPFVYRRYLDFGVIDAIRALHRQIRHAAQRRAILRPDQVDDIKLGRGGIRELEFSVQVLQLIRGGQDAGLRIRPTLDVLAYASRSGLLAPSIARQLCDAYQFLRRVEHRLQYVNDAQTHALPAEPAARTQLAASLGFADSTACALELERHRRAVEDQFERLFADDLASEEDDSAGGSLSIQHSLEIWSDALIDETDEVTSSRFAAMLTAFGYQSPDHLLARLRAVRRSPRYQQLPASSRKRFDRLVQRVLSALSGGAGFALSPVLQARHAMLLRYLDLLEAISRRSTYLALLIEYPAALQRVLTVLGSSRWAADYLIGHPQLLDELLTSEALILPDWPAFKAALRARLAAADGVEQQMDLLRQLHHAEVFRILLLDLQGDLTVEQVGDQLSALADAVLDVTLERVWRSLPHRHRDQPRFALIAYGKLGGKELGYASDLDLIFLYDDPDSAAPDCYLALARRLLTWLTALTGAGRLFDIDLRLRPDGLSGLLVTPLNGFRRYQLRKGRNGPDSANTAWLWEHQALSRARYCAGDMAIGAAFEEIRAQVLMAPRHAAMLAREIVAMRERVAQEHPNPTALFDLKYDRGGMTDIEFIVQYGVLRDASKHRELTANLGNIALLHELAKLAFITAHEAETVGSAYRTYRALQHQLQLDGCETARVAAERVAGERAAVLALWANVFAAR